MQHSPQGYIISEFGSHNNDIHFYIHLSKGAFITFPKSRNTFQYPLSKRVCKHLSKRLSRVVAFIIELSRVQDLNPIFSPEFPFRSISFSQITPKINPFRSITILHFFGGFCRSGDHHFQNFFNFNPFIASHGRLSPNAKRSASAAG